jgi:peptide-methionine (S)-S-oxide reductase
MLFQSAKLSLPTPEQALQGRAQPLQITNKHAVKGSPLLPPFPAHLQQIVFGMGCFWGAERRFWPQQGVYTTAVGYTGGFTPNPSYEEVCSGLTGHNEVILVVFDPQAITLEQLFGVFWESHNPTQGMRQGNDVGTQYRSGIYTTTEAQKTLAEASGARYQSALSDCGLSSITTEVLPLGDWYYAEDYHQQYLAKNPGGYCGLAGTGVNFVPGTC